MREEFATRFAADTYSTYFDGSRKRYNAMLAAVGCGLILCPKFSLVLLDELLLDVVRH